MISLQIQKDWLEFIDEDREPYELSRSDWIRGAILYRIVSTQARAAGRPASVDRRDYFDG